jgi:hypothetical protein
VQLLPITAPIEQTSEPRSGTFTERPAPAHCRLCKPAAGSSSVLMHAGMRTCVWEGALRTTATTTVHPAAAGKGFDPVNLFRGIGRVPSRVGLTRIY